MISGGQTPWRSSSPATGSMAVLANSRMRCRKVSCAGASAKFILQACHSPRNPLLAGASRSPVRGASIGVDGPLNRATVNVAND